MKSERSYPRKVWVITASFEVKEVEVERAFSSGWSRADYGDVTKTGKRYGISEMHDSREQALAAAREVLLRQQKALDEKQERIIERWKKLEKQSGSA